LFVVKTWVITGGIGTGKSAFAACLKRLTSIRCSAFSADAAVHVAYESPVIREQIAGQLCIPYCSEEGSQHFRVRVRSAVLEEPSKRRALEEILHPLVWQAYAEACERGQKESIKVLVAEVPLYYETGGAVAADCVITVAASRATQLHRLQSDRALDAHTSENLLMMQMPLVQKIERADVVIWNDGSFGALEEQALLLLRQANL
jgi:dephospho-CoA kinase